MVTLRSRPFLSCRTPLCQTSVHFTAHPEKIRGGPFYHCTYTLPDRWLSSWVSLLHALDRVFFLATNVVLFSLRLASSIMPPKGASTAINPIRLQSVQKLKIRRPDSQANANPCMGPMSAVLSASPPDANRSCYRVNLHDLGCWASSSSQAAAGGSGSSLNCAALEQALRECMDFSKRSGQTKSEFNYHLSRLYPKIRGPRKKKGSIG